MRRGLLARAALLDRAEAALQRGLTRLALQAEGQAGAVVADLPGRTRNTGTSGRRWRGIDALVVDAEPTRALSVRAAVPREADAAAANATRTAVVVDRALRHALAVGVADLVLWAVAVDLALYALVVGGADRLRWVGALRVGAALTCEADPGIAAADLVVVAVIVGVAPRYADTVVTDLTRIAVFVILALWGAARA